MLNLFLFLARRLRPREGWAMLLMALAAVLCVGQLAGSAQLRLPAAAVTLAGVVGLVVGRQRRATNDERRTTNDERRTDHQQTTDYRLPTTDYPRRKVALGVSRWPLVVGLLLTWLVGVCVFALVVGRALPPLALVWRDGGALAEAVGRWLAQLRPGALVPAGGAAEGLRVDTPAFLGEALPRFWRQLLAAPFSGRSGATLIAALASVLLSWTGGLMLGVGLRRGDGLLGWGLALLAALITTMLLGGGAGAWLFLGLAALLLLVLLGNFAQRERSWQAHMLDYAGDLRLDALFWGGLALALVLPLSAALPSALDNPLARWVWSRVQTPSGLQELERNIELNQRPRQPAPAQVAGSTLPELELGMSLEQGPPGLLALRVQVDQPLPAGPWPHYWRSRVLTSYSGRFWRSPALVAPEAALALPGVPPDGLIAQQVQDLRSERRLVYGLPEVIGVSVPILAERLPDGMYTAASTVADGRYTVYSRPPELTEPQLFDPSRGQEPPDLRPYLLVPASTPPRVADLARALTRDAATRMEAALALEQYLRELPYSYAVAPLPGQGDAVDQFLFEMRQGYCTYYASALALMARSIGIPARVSIGYYTGSYDADSRSYSVYESDAHAWPELYLDGRWLPFEPTPVRPLPARSTSGTQPNAPAVASEPLPAAPLLQRVRPFIPGALVALALLLAALAPWLPRLLRADHTPLAIQRQLERRGARAGVAWPAGATLQEYGLLLRPHLPGSTGALDTLIELLSTERYGQRALSDEERGRLWLAWAAVREGLR